MNYTRTYLTKTCYKPWELVKVFLEPSVIHTALHTWSIRNKSRPWNVLQSACQALSLFTSSTRQVSWTFSLKGWNISLETVAAVENEEMDDSYPLHTRTTEQTSSTLYARAPAIWFKSENQNSSLVRNSPHNYIWVTPVSKAKRCPNES